MIANKCYLVYQGKQSPDYRDNINSTLEYIVDVSAPRQGQFLTSVSDGHFPFLITVYFMSSIKHCVLESRAAQELCSLEHLRPQRNRPRPALILGQLRQTKHLLLCIHWSEHTAFSFCETRQGPPRYCSCSDYRENIEKAISSFWLQTNLTTGTHSGILESNRQCLFEGKSQAEPIMNPCDQDQIKYNSRT